MASQAFGFAYVEGILNAADKHLAVGRSLSLLEGTKFTLDAAGIEQFVYEDFYDTLVSLIESITKPGKDGVLNATKLLEAFQEAEGVFLSAHSVYTPHIFSFQRDCHGLEAPDGGNAIITADCLSLMLVLVSTDSAEPQ